MKTNICILGDCVKEMASLPDGSVDLIVADPPYWKVVSQKWDYMWKTERDYVEWSLSWIKEAARVLRVGGTFYCLGISGRWPYLFLILTTLGLSCANR